MSGEKEIKRVYYLSFPPDTSNNPVVCDLALQHDICFNILKAQITPRREGQMTLELKGTEEALRHGLDSLREIGVKVTPISRRISRDEESCIHCGMCTALCPTDALSLDRETRLVTFDSERCSACGICTTVCPVRAMDVLLDNGR